ncbi:helix-turn-helix domain-containing protein [Streptomyces sp. SID8361]|uniref:helix-turn-helix domain-containing protein n=1 Tax=Streptomyces sp. MnatMP-M27 TaxID=1839768 RepID=UPI00081D421A|nr:helix-turn-helix domain-containing protein [Streptomyces sp. MnatMP-M27]MYU09985.1 helix-turn-helix domain-containing protein [Streptomyces sp. SID8361]SCF67180.1 Helix-turn-helix domain-containing protein [Streptomyces sp. MnatMP-M27]
MRILQTLVGADELTTAQLRDRLPDVPPATMYRHIATLTQAGILEVIHERQVRGTVERSYRVRQDKAVVDADARTAPGDGRTRHIISFVVVPDNASGPDAGTDPS